MSVFIKGLKYLDSNYFEQVTIVDTGDYIDIDVKEDVIFFDTTSVGNKFSEQLRGMSDDEIILAVVQRFLDSLKLNGLTDVGKEPSKIREYSVVCAGYGEKLLKFRLDGSKFKVISKMVGDKYLQDRYDYIWNNDVKNIKISFSPDVSRYDRCVLDCPECKFNGNCYGNEDARCNPYINFVLQVDENGRVLDFERKFMKDLLYYKFGKYGEKIRIKKIYEDVPWDYKSKITEYILECGDMKVFIPYNDSMKFIFNIVDEYNKELVNIKDNVLIRQRKMEGF